MRIGLSMNSAYAVQDVREGARRMVERAAASRAAGLDSLFLGDHHATPVPYYQNVPMLGRLLADWDGPIVGTLHLLPLWHPLLLAEQVATLASLASSRFVLQCAVGPRESQLPAFGVNPAHRPSRFEECLDLLRRLWSGEVVDHEGRYSLSQARVSPRPPERIAVWIGAVAPPAIDRAARLGDGWVANPGMLPDQAARQLAQYRERCEAHGRTPGTRVIRRDVYVGATPEEARATAAPVLASGYRGFPEGAAVVGDVDSVAADFAVLRDQGYEHVLARNLVPDQPQALACIERLGGVREALLP